MSAFIQYRYSPRRAFGIITFFALGASYIVNPPFIWEIEYIFITIEKNEFQLGIDAFNINLNSLQLIYKNIYQSSYGFKLNAFFSIDCKSFVAFLYFLSNIILQDKTTLS